MFLAQSPIHQNAFWNDFATLLLQALKPNLEGRLPGVFALSDWQTLLLSRDTEVMDFVARAEIHVLEGVLITSIQEVMEPLQFQSELQTPWTISIESLYQLGWEHLIRFSSRGYELSGRKKSRPSQESEEIRIFSSPDEVAHAITLFEQEKRKEKSLLHK